MNVDIRNAVVKVLESLKKQGQRPNGITELENALALNDSATFEKEISEFFARLDTILYESEPTIVWSNYQHKPQDLHANIKSLRRQIPDIRAKIQAIL